MPHALLLSPDDQAVSAITGVLEEMSVTCERPMDGPSAAKKLSAQTFDLVLVDCENLPAAKLIFDVCRRAKEGGNPVPIAIVDGRAGLPTAFRLGAELILTKPVAKDQARTTIRTAVNRLKKDDPARTIQPFEDTSAEVGEPAAPEKNTQAAAAVAASSLSSGNMFAGPSTPSGEPVARAHSAMEEIAATPPAPTPKPTRELSTRSSIAELPKSKPSAKTSPADLSEDPVLADLEAQSDLPTPVFSSYKEPVKKKGKGSLIALLMLLLAGGGFYAAWMYQPGFREMAQPQIDRVLALIGMPGASQSAAPVRPVPAPSRPTTPAPNPTAPAASPASDTPAAPASTTETTSPTPAATDSAAPVPQAAEPTTASATPASDTPKPAATASRKKDTIAALPSETELPGEKNAVILSSQGAEKRLLHHQPPVYPAEARKERIEGTVVLKAVVGETGKVEGVRLVEGNPVLATAAINAVKQWHYRPYLRDGQTRPFQTIVLVEFQRN